MALRRLRLSNGEDLLQPFFPCMTPSAFLHLNQVRCYPFFLCSRVTLLDHCKEPCSTLDLPCLSVMLRYAQVLAYHICTARTCFTSPSHLPRTVISILQLSVHTWSSIYTLLRKTGPKPDGVYICQQFWNMQNKTGRTIPNKRARPHME